MDEIKKDGCCHMCESQASCHVCGYHQRHLLLRWLLGLLVLGIVFWVGFKLGEFKGEFMGDGFGYGRMMTTHHPMMNYQYGGEMGMYDETYGVGGQAIPPMMLYRSEAAPSVPAVPSETAPSAGTTTKTKAAK